MQVMATRLMMLETVAFLSGVEQHGFYALFEGVLHLVSVCRGKSRGTTCNAMYEVIRPSLTLQTQLQILELLS